MTWKMEEMSHNPKNVGDSKESGGGRLSSRAFSKEQSYPYLEIAQ